MSETGEGDARQLAELRGKIDAIDAEMHRLLIERGTVIDMLIELKGTSRPGNAFRPGREAEMMHRLAARHDGHLPLPTVEHIWREIITTFTRMQAPFDVAIDVAVEPERMRDLARFYFGFSVGLVPAKGPAATIARVAEANDLGLVALDQPARAGAWWRGLVGPERPRIMALLPFIGAKERPADLPAFVISPKLADPTTPDLRIYAVTCAGELAKLGKAIGESVVFASVKEGSRTDILIGIPNGLDEHAIAARAKAAGIAVANVAEVGGIARGVAVDVPVSLLYEKVAAR